jgi:hypothetical protein
MTAARGEPNKGAQGARSSWGGEWPARCQCCFRPPPPAALVEAGALVSGGGSGRFAHELRGRHAAAAAAVARAPLRAEPGPGGGAHRQLHQLRTAGLKLPLRVSAGVYAADAVERCDEALGVGRAWRAAARTAVQ